MKLFGSWFSVWLLSLPLSAQVSVKVVPDQDQFLPGETLPVAVQISNRSGQTLHLGGEEDWVTFSVESKDGFVVSKSGEVPVKGDFVLDSSKVATKRVDLSPHFELGRPGRYLVTATVRIKEWDREFSGKPAAFDIITGTKLWEQEFGVPLRAGQSGDPEVRKYALQQANYLKRELRLYARVTDASEAKVFRVFSIGPLVSFSRPEPQVDKSSNLHVLCQSGARAFTYSVINPDGELVARQTYDYINSRPRLKVDDAGKIVVVGGLRRPTRDDLPVPENAANDLKSSKP